VLTNGVNVGGRLGTPAAPGALAAGAVTKDILSGQGLRLQIVNCATLRYFRLRLTTEAGAMVNLVRVGGEGGLLDNAILEGGMMGTINIGFDSGEIVLPPATRADVVAAIPAGLPLNSVLTLWTRDYQKAGGSNPGNWAQHPTVPVMHLKVTGSTGPFTIGAGTALRAPAGMPAVETLGPSTGSLLAPLTIGKIGNPSQDIQIQTTPGGPARIDGVTGEFLGTPHYTDSMHIGSSRYASQSTGGPTTVLELAVTNTTTAHHPFHLHGFSFQPKLDFSRLN
jgi:FtsP/CotA-like multicopper oxidase with cupredoxin domain